MHAVIKRFSREIHGKKNYNLKRISFLYSFRIIVYLHDIIMVLYISKYVYVFGV